MFDMLFFFEALPHIWLSACFGLGLFLAIILVTVVVTSVAIRFLDLVIP